MASLTIVVDGVEQKFPLDNPVVTLGRGLESDIRLKDIKASRRHCQIQKTPKGFQCLDLSSGNGTFVNGVQIKTQMLDPGDKIQIGSTIITFVDAVRPAPASGKVATAARAASAAPAAPPHVSSTKTATSKIASAQVPVVPTRRATVRSEAPRASSKQLPKVNPVAPTRKSTARSVRPPKPPESAPEKKSPVVRIVAALLVLGLLGAGAWFFLGSRDNSDQLRGQIELAIKKGREAETADKLDLAGQEYQKALELCQGDRFKSRAAEVRRMIQQLQARKESGSALPPQDAQGGTGKGPDFQARRAEIADRHKLGGDAASADWGGAVKDWKDYLARKPAADAEAKAQAELKALLDRAREDLARLRKKAESLAQENKGAEAVMLLKQQQPRFQNTDLAGELESAIKQYDK